MHAPIGLENKSETPEEIGISIAAEMIMVRGVGADIRGLVNAMRRLRGVLQVEFVITSPGEDLHD